jgi:hypothetical protein
MLQIHQQHCCIFWSNSMIQRLWESGSHSADQTDEESPCLMWRSQYRSVWGLHCGLDYRGIGVWFPAEARDFTFLQSIHTSSGPHPAFLLNRTRGHDGKLAKPSSDYLPTSSVEVKYAQRHTSIPPYSFIAWCLIMLLWSMKVCYYGNKTPQVTSVMS